MFWIQHVCAESSMNVSSQYVMRCVFDVYYSQTNPCDAMCVCVKIGYFQNPWSPMVNHHFPTPHPHAALDVQLGTSEDFEVRFAESNEQLCDP